MFRTDGDENIAYPGVNDAAHNYGYIRNHDKELAGSGFGKITYQEFTFEADYDKRAKDNSAATYLAMFDDPGRMTERRDDVSLKWDHPVAEGQSLHAEGFFSQYTYDQWWGQMGETAPFIYRSTAQSDWFGEDVHYDWQVNKQNRLTLGTEGMQAVRAHQEDEDSLGDHLIDINNSLNWWALYAQDEYTPVEWLTLVAGLRMDKIQRFEPLFDPRFAAIITPSKTDCFKLMYGRAFREPNLYEMFYSSPGANAPNPYLKPEINDTFEATWDHDYGQGWHTEAGYYLWQMKNSLGEGTLDDALQVQNIGTTWAQGAECEVTKKWANGGQLRLSGMFGHAEDEHGHTLPQSPDVIVAMAGILPVYKRTFLSIEPQMLGPMVSDTGVRNEATFLTNVVLTSKNIWRGLDIQVGVYNLFGNAARYPRPSVWNQYEPYIPAPGVQVLLSATYRF
jgi:iron complex outermembrane receptor protein